MDDKKTYFDIKQLSARVKELVDWAPRGDSLAVADIVSLMQLEVMLAIAQQLSVISATLKEKNQNGREK